MSSPDTENPRAAAYALRHAMDAVLHHPYLPSPRDDAARS
jgi:hypothetical protein